MEHSAQSHRPDARAGFIHSPLGWTITLGLAGLGIYLFATHTGHVLTALPYVLLVACPLIHLFGHKHKHHG